MNNLKLLSILLIVATGPLCSSGSESDSNNQLELSVTPSVVHVEDDSEYTSAANAYHEGRYYEAIPILQKLARDQHAAASYLFAQAFEQGNGVKLNDGEAFKWFLVSANLGYVEAQMKLAITYGDTTFPNSSAAESYRWYSLAAAGGNIEAMRHQGAMLIDGELDYLNYERGLNLIKQSWLLGNVEAGRVLGAIYSSNPVLRDFSKSRDWYLKAANKGDPRSMIDAAKLLLFHSEVNESDVEQAKLLLTKVPEEFRGFRLLLEAKYYLERSDFELAKKLYEEAAAMGSDIAYYYLGIIARDSEMSTNQGADISSNFKISCSLGYSRACYGLGAFYYNGEILPSDREMAFDYFLRGAELGEPNSIYAVASAYLKGEGVDRNITTGLQFLHQASDAGVPMANAKLGYRYLTGKGVEKNDKKGLSLTLEAAKKGISSAKYYTAMAYFRSAKELMKKHQVLIDKYRASSGDIVLEPNVVDDLNTIEIRHYNSTYWMVAAQKDGVMPAKTFLAKTINIYSDFSARSYPYAVFTSPDSKSEVVYRGSYGDIAKAISSHNEDWVGVYLPKHNIVGYAKAAAGRSERYLDLDFPRLGY